MAFVEYAVEELIQPLKIQEEVLAYAELQMGIQRHNRMTQAN